MIEVDNNLKMIIADLHDKLACIIKECDDEIAYAGYIDEKLKSIECDIKVLRNRVNEVLRGSDE